MTNRLRIQNADAGPARLIVQMWAQEPSSSFMKTSRPLDYPAEQLEMYIREDQCIIIRLVEGQSKRVNIQNCDFEATPEQAIARHLGPTGTVLDERAVSSPMDTASFLINSGEQVLISEG